MLRGLGDLSGLHSCWVAREILFQGSTLSHQAHHPQRWRCNSMEWLNPPDTPAWQVGRGYSHVMDRFQRGKWFVLEDSSKLVVEPHLLPVNQGLYPRFNLSVFEAEGINSLSRADGGCVAATDLDWYKGLPAQDRCSWGFWNTCLKIKPNTLETMTVVAAKIYTICQPLF